MANTDKLPETSSVGYDLEPAFYRGNLINSLLIAKRALKLQYRQSPVKVIKIDQI